VYYVRELDCLKLLVQVIRGRLHMQLTDKVLLPATISYTGSEQPCSDDVTQRAGVHQLTAAAGHGVVQNVAVSADDEDGAGSDVMNIADVCPLTLDNPAHPVTVSGCVESDKPYAEPHQAEQNSADATGSVSVMTVSLVDFPSDCIRDAIEGNSTLLQPLPTAVHIDSTFLQSADTNVVITESAPAGEHESITLMNSAVSNHDDPEVQQPAEWTRYLTIMSCFHLTAF